MVATPVGARRWALGLLLVLTGATFSYLWWQPASGTNMLLHMANVGLAFFLFVETMPLVAATVGAALFAVHPVQAEAVSLLAGRPELIATGFALLSTQAWRRRWHWVAAFWFVGALVASPMVAALPAFFILVEMSYGSRRQGGMAALTTMMFAAAVALALVPMTQGGLPGMDRLLGAAPALGHFARVLVLPSSLSIWPDVDQSAIARFLAWMVLAVLCGAALGAFGRLRLGFWFLASLVLFTPSFALFTGAEAAADRRLYLPMLAIAAVAGRFFESTNA